MKENINQEQIAHTKNITNDGGKRVQQKERSKERTITNTNTIHTGKY